MKPPANSIRATEKPTSTEIIEAARTVAARSAATARSLTLYLLKARQLVEAMAPGSG
jgi:hypothetical protein